MQGRTKAVTLAKPNCDGQPLAETLPGTPAGRLLWKAQRELVDAYDAVNRAYFELKTCRTRPQTERDPEVEYQLLQKIEAALLVKENLENRYAARGISVIPVYRDGLTIDLLFQHPGKAKYLVAGSSSSRFVTLDVPAELRSRPRRAGVRQ